MQNEKQDIVERLRNNESEHCWAAAIFIEKSIRISDY